MNPAAPHHYTAAQIGRALNITRQAILSRLAQIQSSTAVIRGQTSRAWSLASLPQSLQSELEKAMQERGCRDIHHLLASDPPKPYALPIPWSAIPESHRKNAERLCTALAPALARQHELPGPDLMQFAADQYRRVFGNEVSPDRLRFVMDRATKRDKGFGQWQSPALYLDDAAFHTAPAVPALKPGLHAELDDTFSEVKDKSNPTPEDRRHIFPKAFRHMEAAAVAQPSKGRQRAFKQSLIQYLYNHVPGLHRPQAASDAREGKPLLALRSQFNRVYQSWVSQGRPALLPADKRAGSCGRKPYAHLECDNKITRLAAGLRGDRGEQGNTELAIKQLSERRAICAACIEHYQPGRLSAVARTRLTPNALQIAYLKGPQELREIGPTHHTQWDTTPGDRFVIDDMTTNELSWDEVNGQIISGQTQLLFTEDEYSSFPLPFLLYFGAPNGVTIKKAISLVLMRYGLPRLELLTERGVFAARKISGERGIQHHFPFRKLQAEMEAHFKFAAVPDEVLAQIRKRDLGLRDPAFRLSIEQAMSPQAKTVERSFYELQKSASRLPGFAGFNQRNEQPRWMQDFDRRVKTGKEHPGNEYLHLSELKKNYEVIMAEIAARPVNGMRHRGRSPRDLWQEEMDRRPLLKLPPEIEALLATQRRPDMKVYPQGIRVRLDKFETAFYFNEHTGPLVGRQVAVRINPEIPQYIHMEHPDTGKLLKVQRNLTKRTTATPQELAAVNQARRAHVNGALGEIGNVENPAAAWVIRDNMHAPGDIEHGAQITIDAAQHKEEEARSARDNRKLAQKAAILGTSIPDQPRNAARVNEGLDLEAEARAEIAALNKEQTP